MEDEISPKKSSAHKVVKDYRKKPALNKKIFVIVFAVLFGSVCFYWGTLFQKSKDNSNNNSTALNQTSSGNGSFGGGYGRYRSGSSNRVFGQVSAINSSSISIQDPRTNSTVTLSITSSTQISDSGQSVTSSDIQTGDTVIASKSSTNSAQAANIIVNPSFGGGFSGQSSGGGSGTSTPPPNISTN